ncbi:MAG TPA: DNA polymerase III subunit epsilon [Burkholderiales bacterium]|jgi:DNA polymerase III subunit epsilon|nr:DNA polymerase III subunit epsilon [Burkholderiales bacterium]
MRQIILDTETTGLNARLGDRIIEVAGIELVNRRLTGNHFHRYVNPGRVVEEGALKVHGITDEFLADKPPFAEVVAEFLDYVRGAELVIHNAAFDVEFLNVELALLGFDPIQSHVASVVDTLRQARELHPGKKNSLDALCERYAVDNSHRRLHGALLDCELLAEVYLAMTRGQESLAIELEMSGDISLTGIASIAARPPVLVLRASAEEEAEHLAMLEAIAKESKGRCVWQEEETAAAAA